MNNVLGHLLENENKLNDLLNQSFYSAKNKLNAIDEIYKKAFPRFKVKFFFLFSILI